MGRAVIGKVLFALAVAGTASWATSHCYLQRTYCFDVDDGKAKVKMYTKRHTFSAAGEKHHIAKSRIEAIIKAAEGVERRDEREDLRDARGYYGGVYWPYPIYAYPPHHHHPHHDKPDRPERPNRPIRPDGPVTIQPTENPILNRPDSPQRPIQRPERPIQRPIQRPSRPIQRPVNRPRPRPIRR